MPILVSVRQDYSSCIFRDVVVNAFKDEGINAIYIASGFFSDFTNIISYCFSDLSLENAMSGKKLYLFGGYDLDKTKVDFQNLSSSLKRKKVDVTTHLIQVSPGVGNDNYKWHAKLAIFISNSEPVLAICGSSNFTGASMFGPSDSKYFNGVATINVEGDTFFWKKRNSAAANVMHQSLTSKVLRDSVAFDSAGFDDEVAKLIENISQSIINAPWDLK